MERWRSVVGFENIYEVSDLGRVRSLARTVEVVHPSGARNKPVRQRLMKPLRSFGAMYVNLNPGGIKRKVHHLVLEAFVGPRPDGDVTRHLNGDITDNRLTNIVYGSQGENRLDAVKHDNHKVARSTVTALRAETGLSERKMAAKYGVSRTYVRLVRAGKTRTAG